MVLVLGIGTGVDISIFMFAFVLVLCLSLCIIFSHWTDTRVFNDFVLDFLLHLQIQFTRVYMHVSLMSIHMIHTKNDVCIYVRHLYL